MFLLKSKHLCLLFLLILGISVSAQGDKFNHFSVEITAGVHIPLAPNLRIRESKYIAFKQFQLSGRYMLTDKLGLKGHYAFNRFSNPEDANMGLSFNRIGLEGVVNLGKLLKVNYRFQERFGVLFHTGLGITFAQPSSVNGTDHIGNILAGFTGQVKINNSFTFLLDSTYLGSYAQQYKFDGSRINKNNDKFTGTILNFSIGIMYNFGNEKYHADWY